MKTVLLFRHGETKLPGCKGKRVNCPLSEVGEAQTRRNVEYAMSIMRGAFAQTLVATSPLIRASRFSEIWREQEGYATHVIMPELIDLDVGVWEGKQWNDIEREYPEQYRMMREDGRRLVIPGAERIDLYVERILNTWRRLLHSQYANLVIVGHSATNEPIMADAEGRLHLDFGSQKHGCMNHILVDDDRRMTVIDRNATLLSAVHA